MHILLIVHFCVGFMVSDISRVSVFGYFPYLHIYSARFSFTRIKLTNHIHLIIYI